VWHPGALSLEADDAELNLIDGCSARFETTRLRLRSGALDLTPLLREDGLDHTAGVDFSVGFASGGVFVEGIAAGSAEVWLVTQPSVRLSLSVSSAVVTPLLSAHLVTGSGGSPFVLTASLNTFEVLYTFGRQFDSEGDAGSILAFVSTAGGSWPLPPSDLTVAALTSSITVSESAPWSGTVAEGAERQCADVLNVTWAVCPGVSVTAAVYAFLQLPSPDAVRITTAGVALAPQGDLATLSGIGKPS